MEKNRNIRIILVICFIAVALVVTIGFAAFSKTFTTKNFNTNVSANSASSFSLMMTSSDGTVSGDTFYPNTFDFTSASSTKTYTINIKNNSAKYNAYLASATSNNVKVTCSSVVSGEASSESVASICSKVRAAVTFSGQTLGTITSTAALNKTYSINGRGNVSITPSSTKTATITVSFSDTSIVPDGDVKIMLPPITFSFTSIQ